MSYGKMNGFADIVKAKQVKDSVGFTTTQDEVLASVRVYREGRHGSRRWANLAAFSEATDLFRFRCIPGLTVTTDQFLITADGRYDIVSVENSPSKEMAWIGDMLTQGLANGINESAKVAVNAAQSLNEGIMGVMDSLADDMQTAVPSSFNLDADATVRSATSGVLGKAASAFTIALNITNFNNYSSEDIRQLTNEVMETANQFAQRKGVVFA